MQDLKNFYLPSIIILLFLIRLGASQHFNGGDTSSSTNDPNFDFIEHKKNGVKEGPKPNTTSAVEITRIVTTRFRTEMAMLFSWLPASEKCNILTDMSQMTKCSMPDVIVRLSSLSEMKPNLNVSCAVKDRTKFKPCTPKSKVFVSDMFYEELLRTLPSPFKCHVINTIALAYKFKGRRTLSLSVSQVQNTLAEMFPSVSLRQTCVVKEMDHIVPSIPPVNITVYLNNVNKHTWLQALKTKGPVVYRTAFIYEFEARHKGKVLGRPASLAQYLAEHQEEISSARLYPVFVGGGDKIFSVLFKLKVKRKQSDRFREIRSTFRIQQALASKTTEELKAIFNATVISISLSRERSSTTKAPPKTNKWTFNKMYTAKEFFPDKLSEYYKNQLVKQARCFVMFYISKKLNKTPKEIEMFYVTIQRFSRKHSCYYTKRTVATDKPLIIEQIDEERFTGRLSTPTPVVNRTEMPSNESNNAIDHISNRVDEDDLSSLEIALFALLGALCLSVLAFTVNCVLLAMKSKAAYQSNKQPTTGFKTAVFYEGTNVRSCERIELVHLSKRNGCLHQQPSNFQHPLTTETCIQKDLHCWSSDSASASNHIRRCDHDGTSTEHHLTELHDSGENRTNSRARLENEYCLNSSQSIRRSKTSQSGINDSAAKDTPTTEESSSKDECECSTRSLGSHSVWDNDVVLESQGKANSSQAKRTLKSSQPCINDSGAKDECECPTRVLDSHNVLDNDVVLESQGKAISYCSISDCRLTQPSKMMHTGRLPSEEAHETVIVLLDCDGYKEVQV